MSKPTCSQSENLQYYNVSSCTHGNIADVKKARPFDVENLIQKNTLKEVFPNSEQPNQSNIDSEVTKNESHVTDNAFHCNNYKIDKDEEDCIILYPGVTINGNDESESKVIDDVSNSAIKLMNSNPNTVSKTIVTATTNSTTNSHNTFRNLDRSGEIKHAQTPINTAVQQSHSPQLPVSSPSYPVQTLLSSDFDCSEITIVESNKVYDNNTNFNAFEPSSSIKESYSAQTENSHCAYDNGTVAQIPNLQLVSNTNNAYSNGTGIIGNECKNSVSFWDLHLPYSTASTFNVQVKEREIMSNITIKDLLSHNADTDGPANDNKPIRIGKSKILCNNTPTSNTESSCVVLNVPSLNAHQPPFKKQKISKIDIATKKRKQQREKRNLKRNIVKQELISENDAIKVKKERIVFERITTHKGTVTDFGVPVFGFSDSSSSSSCSSSDYESDSLDTDSINLKNISLELDFSQEKLEFLKLFGIITYRKRNAVELEKLERRKWQPRWIPAIEHTTKVALDLPVPSITSSSVNHSTNNPLKIHFLHILGLQSFSSDMSYDHELNWLKVIEDRIKRNSASPLTEYCVKVHQSYLQSVMNNKDSQSNEIVAFMPQNKYENQSFKQKACKQSKYLKYLRKSCFVGKPNYINNNSTAHSAIPLLKNTFDDGSNKFHYTCNDKIKFEDLSKDSINIPTFFHNNHSGRKKGNYLLKEEAVKNECHFNHSDYLYDDLLAKRKPVNTFSNKRLLLKNSESIYKIKKNGCNEHDSFYLNKYVENKCDSSNQMIESATYEDIKYEKYHGSNKKFNGESPAPNVILKTPNLTNNLFCKNLKNRYIQTESNYVLPLAMILVDNRTIQQGTLTDQVSNGILKNNMLNKSTQCTITQEISHLKHSNSKKIQSSDTFGSCTSNNVDVPKWPGIHKLVESYHLHSKDCDAEIKLLKESLKNLKEAVYANQCEARTLERDRRLLQSTSFMYEQDRIQMQTKIDNFNTVIDAFR